MALEVEAGATEQHIHSPMLNDDDAEIERLLSEKLLEGYTLMERICPSCATPLVKNKNNHAMEESKQKQNVEAFVVPSKSFEQPFQPVLGVPFCVSCQAHVVTEESEISVLERCDSLKMKGQILVALNSITETETPSEITGVEKEVEEGQRQEEGKSKSKFGYDFLCGPEAVSTKEEKHDGQPHHEHSDEKKDDYEPPHVGNADAQPSIEDQSADDLMAEYSVR